MWAHSVVGMSGFGSGAQTSKKPLILGVGTIGLDYISYVDKFPEEDSKVRNSGHKIGGGGNVGNTATAVAKLGLCRAALLTQVGKDANASSVLEELNRDGVDTSLVIRNEEITTPFTYILVDTTKNTRTCIHTPMAQEMTIKQIQQLKRKKLKKGSPDPSGPMEFELPFLIHLDSRQTKASLELVRAYYELMDDEQFDIPRPIISIDCEKYRPPLMRTLMEYCHVVFTNINFPDVFPEIRNPKIEGGFEGTRFGYISDEGKAEVSGLSDILGDEEELISSITKKVNGMADILRSGKIGMVVTSLGAMGSLLIGGDDEGSEDGGSKSDLTHPVKKFQFSRDERTSLPSGENMGHPTYMVLYCPAYPLAPESVVDTTGAGDAFIGGFLSAYCQDKGDLCSAMIMGTLTAAKKIMKPGAREGLPHGPEELEEMASQFSKC